MKKKTIKPTYTVQVKLVTVVDVEVEAQTLDDALEIGRAWKRSDIIEYTKAVSENDHHIKVLGVYSQEDWGTSN
jgi:hypothetical protein